MRNFKGPLVPFAPSEHAPFRLGEHVLSAEGEDIGHMPFARAATWGDGEDEFDVAWVDLLMTGDADRPGKPACAQRLTELGAMPTLRRQGLSRS